MPQENFSTHHSDDIFYDENILSKVANYFNNEKSVDMLLRSGDSRGGGGGRVKLSIGSIRYRRISRWGLLILPLIIYIDT